MTKYPKSRIKSLECFVLLTVFIFGSAVSGFAQSLRIYFGVGGIYHNFQDARFSDWQLDKFSLQPELGFEYSKKHHSFSFNINAHGYEDEHPAADTMYSALQLNARFGYLYQLNDRFAIGGTWDIVDISVYEQVDLDNSNNTYLTATDWFFTFTYYRALNDNWKLRAGVDWGLFSLVKLAPSFTANFQQNIVDNGNVSFQDPDSRDGFSLKYADPKFFWEQLNVRTNVEVLFKKRFSLAYIWKVRSIWEQTGYPVTQAQHTLTLRYHFISRHKETPTE